MQYDFLDSLDCMRLMKETPMSADYMVEIDRDIKPVLKPGKRTCQCAGCDLYFSSPAAFDRHQYDGKDCVICRTEPEMLAIGMKRNPHGVWLYGISKEKAEAA